MTLLFLVLLLQLPYHHTHTCLTALFPGLPGWAGTKKVEPIWILRKQETVSGSGIIWAICKSAPSSREITMPAVAPHHSVFYRLGAIPAAQPTASKHWRQIIILSLHLSYICTEDNEQTWTNIWQILEVNTLTDQIVMWYLPWTVRLWS